MTEDRLTSVKQFNCKHEKTKLYSQSRFDIPNGLEVTFTRCLDCHKIVALEAKKYKR